MGKKKKVDSNETYTFAEPVIKNIQKPIRFALYKQYRISGMDRFNSAIKAGYSRNTAITASRNLESKWNFAEFMRQQGLTDEFLVKKIKDGFEANKVISARIVGADANESTDDFIEVPDHAIRHKYLETALKAKGRLNVNDAPVATTINFSLAVDGQAQPVIDITASETTVAIGVDSGPGKC